MEAVKTKPTREHEDEWQNKLHHAVYYILNTIALENLPNQPLAHSFTHSTFAGWENP